MADHHVEGVPPVLQGQLQLALDLAQRGTPTVVLVVWKAEKK